MSVSVGVSKHDLKSIDKRLREIGYWGYYRVLEEDEIGYKKVVLTNGTTNCRYSVIKSELNDRCDECVCQSGSSFTTLSFDNPVHKQIHYKHTHTVYTIIKILIPKGTLIHETGNHLGKI